MTDHLLAVSAHGHPFVCVCVYVLIPASCKDTRRVGLESIRMTSFYLTITMSLVYSYGKIVTWTNDPSKSGDSAQEGEHVECGSVQPAFSQEIWS